MGSRYWGDRVAIITVRVSNSRDVILSGRMPGDAAP